MSISTKIAGLVVVGTAIASYVSTGPAYQLCRFVGKSTIECQQKAVMNNVSYVVDQAKKLTKALKSATM